VEKMTASVDKSPITHDLGGGVFSIDTMMGGFEGITSSYFIASDRPVLIETGAALSAPRVQESLTLLGCGPQDLATIVVTHIHLDHAGGVGDLAKEYPNARIVVHERGARHLADPAKLVASAYRVFGPKMDEMFGPLLPTNPLRIDALGERGSIDLGAGRRLDTFHNPGHASHHIALIDSETGDLYTGDAAGVYIPETGDIRPATPPPDFDFQLALNSLKAMQAVGPNRLLFSHFGPTSEIERIFEESLIQLHHWVEWVKQAHHEGMDFDHALLMVLAKDREMNAEFFAHPEVSSKFEHLSSSEAQVSGIWHWLEKQNQSDSSIS
jgi:glyoxylase-like metal-dependent hydrolase (beta-lactamase superfamily II)